MFTQKFIGLAQFDRAETLVLGILGELLQFQQRFDELICWTSHGWLFHGVLC